MQDNADIIEAIYQIVKDKNLDTFILGGVYQVERPINSEAEDLVINTLGVFGDNFSEGFANVNVYVPKKLYDVKGTDTLLRNGERVRDVIKRLRDDFKLNKSPNYLIWTDSHQEIAQAPEAKETWINFRLEFRIFI